MAKIGRKWKNILARGVLLRPDRMHKNILGDFLKNSIGER
jgi:hypothetical protein